jgi:hypothetical protein
MPAEFTPSLSPHDFARRSRTVLLRGIEPRQFEHGGSLDFVSAHLRYGASGGVDDVGVDRALREEVLYARYVGALGSNKTFPPRPTDSAVMKASLICSNANDFPSGTEIIPFATRPTTSRKAA